MTKDMTDSTKSKTDKRVFDVAKPSTTPASPTSKPLIVAHGPIMHDSTIVENENGEEKTDEQTNIAMTSTHNIKIEPLNDIETDKHEAESVPNGDNIQVSDDKTLDQSKSEDQPLDPKPEQTTEVKQDNEVKSATDESKTEAQTTKSAEDGTSEPTKTVEDPKILEEEQRLLAEKQAKINGLVDSGKYFLPINMVEKRKNQRVVIVGIIICIILAIAWVDVALDAGLISNSLHLPHTHFFALKS